MTERTVKGYRNSYLSYLLMYVFYFLSMSISSSLISVYLMSKGYSGTEVSLVVSGSYFSSMILQPFFGILYDRYNIKKLNLLLFILAMISAFVFIFCRQLITVVIVYSILTILISATDTVIERIATAAPYPYGKIRIWGTVGYALGVQLAGILFDYIAPEAIYVTFILTLMLCTAGMLGTEPEFREEKSEKKETVSIRTLFTNTKYLYYLLLTAIITGCISAGHTYIPAMLTNIGMDASRASTVLSLATVCEAPFVLFSAYFMDRFSNKQLLFFIFGVVLIQNAIYSFRMPLGAVIAITLVAKQIPDMVLIMTNLKVVNTIVDQRQQMTALALIKTVRSLSSIIFNNIAGNIIDLSGYTSMFRVMMFILILGCIILFFYKIPKGDTEDLFH